MRPLPLRTHSSTGLNSAWVAFCGLNTHERQQVFHRRYSHPVDKSTGLRSDQTVILAAIESAQAYPDPLRRVSYFDARTNKRLKFLTNNFALPALTIAHQCCPGKVAPSDGKSRPLNVLWPVLPGNDLKSRGRKWSPERSIRTRHNEG